MGVGAPEDIELTVVGIVGVERGWCIICVEPVCLLVTWLWHGAGTLEDGGIERLLLVLHLLAAGDGRSAPWLLQPWLSLSLSSTSPCHGHSLDIHVGPLARSLLGSFPRHMLLVLGQHCMLLLLGKDVLLGEQRLLLTPHWLLLSQQGLLLRCQNSGACLLCNILELLLSLDPGWFWHFDWIPSVPLHDPLLPLLPLRGDPRTLLLVSSALGDNGSSLPLLLAECSVQALLRVAERLLDQLLSNCASLAARCCSCSLLLSSLTKMGTHLQQKQLSIMRRFSAKPTLDAEDT